MRGRPALGAFLRLCWKELGKVGWSSRRSLTHNAAIVFVVVTLVIVVLGALELGIATLVHAGLR